VGKKEKEHEGVSKEGSPAAAREGAAEISAGGGAQGCRLGSNAAGALRCWVGDGEGLRRCSATSRNRRWRRLALKSGDRGKSATAALQS
jgi:hypothetical protein